MYCLMENDEDPHTDEKDVLDNLSPFSNGCGGEGQLFRWLWPAISMCHGWDSWGNSIPYFGARS